VLLEEGVKICENGHTPNLLCISYLEYGNVAIQEDGMGKKKARPTWYRRMVDAVLPPDVWSDRRKFLTGVACAGLAWVVNRFPYPGAACVPKNTALMPLAGELGLVGELVIVKIGAGDRISVGLGG
jgi:hypothetical protein